MRSPIGDANPVERCSPRSSRLSRTRDGLSRVQSIRAVDLARPTGKQQGAE
jgi:hypothetical protein